jgi:predicted RNA methylase
LPGPSNQHFIHPRPTVAKLTKQEVKLHEQALRLLEKDVLTFDDKHFVLDCWHEGANHVNSAAGAFFTPHSIAEGVGIEACGKKFIDLGAGIGRLAFTVRNYKNPFRDDRKHLEFTCVEVNPDYIEVGKKIMPEARWIRADILDLPADIGRFDCAIGNPPFGKIQSKQRSPRLTSGSFEYKAIDVASDIADYGVFIVPQSSAPFRFSGVRAMEWAKSDAYLRFEQNTDIELDANCGIDTTYEANWRGINIVTEIVLADFLETRKRRNSVAEAEEEMQSNLTLVPAREPAQGELFPWAA